MFDYKRIGEGELPLFDLYPLEHYPFEDVSNSSFKKNEEDIRFLRNQMEDRNAIKEFKLSRYNSIGYYEMLAMHRKGLPELCGINAFDLWVSLFVSCRQANKRLLCLLDLDCTQIVVTRFDKILAMSIIEANFELDDYNGPIFNQKLPLMIDTYRRVQEKELLYKKTINFKRFGLDWFDETHSGDTDDIDVLNMLLFTDENWNIPLFQEYLYDISDRSVKLLGEAIEQRDKQEAQFIDKLKCAVEYVNKPDSVEYWNMLLKLLNQRRKNEKEAYESIFNPNLSKREKTEVLEAFTNQIEESEDAETYYIGEKSITQEYFLKMLRERSTYAPCSFYAKDKDGCVYELALSAAYFAFDPSTFNYLLILYHLFRLKGSWEKAFDLLFAISYFLSANIGDESDITTHSIQAYIDYIYDTIIVFCMNHQAELYSVTSDYIVNDLFVLSYESLYEELYSKWDRYLENEDRISEFERIQEHSSSNAELTKKAFKKMNSVFKQFVSEEKSKSFIYSTNAISIYANTLDILLSNEDLHEYIDVEKTEKARNDIKSLIYRTEGRVYRNVPLFSPVPEDVRNEIGVNSLMIERKESEIESNLRKQYIRLIAEIQLEIQSAIDANDLDKLSTSFSEAKHKLLGFQPFDDKEILYETFINTPLIMSESLSADSRFAATKEKLTKVLGKFFDMIPEVSQYSLISAEILFNEKANGQFDKNGFDYSCVSSLYYQSFETIFNSIIWEDYISYLNSIRYDNKSFLECYRNDRYNSFTRQYLPDDSMAKSAFSNNKYLKECTLGALSNLLKESLEDGSLEAFKRFFIEQLDYSSNNDPYKNREWRNRLYVFKEQMFIAFKRRNDASHGSKRIDLLNCKKDRDLVISANKGIIPLFFELYNS
ncbi:MAG: hypothetical protein K6A80_08750 [Saccharofermentans sp.]|nr:hypothetical protein [Saccharofermentans sp.]